MLFMNEDEIDIAADRYRGHPVLGKATRFLAAFREEVNEHSDGWPYWRPPVVAAAQLMRLIQNPDSATEAALKKAMSPIRTFYTRRGSAAGMKFPADAPSTPKPEDPNVHYERRAELFVCRSCEQSSINRGDFKHGRNCKASRKTITRDELARLSFTNSQHLPQAINDGGVRKEWVGIGWIPSHEPPAGNEAVVIESGTSPHRKGTTVPA